MASATNASQAYSANVAILRDKTINKSWFNTIWARWSGATDISRDDNGNTLVRPSGKPIEMMTEFIQKGRDNMLLPMRMDLSGAPVFGDTVVEGTGEDQDLDFLRLYVNQTRKAVMAQSGAMANEYVKIYNMIEAATPQLSKWLSKYDNQDVSRAFYEGVGENLSVGTADDGKGLYKRYHPNWYYNDGGVLTSAGTAGSTKTNAHLDTAAASGLYGLTSDIVEYMNPVLMERMIPQIVSENGMPYWACLISPQQKITLLADSGFKAANQAAWNGLSTNAELQGFVGYYMGVAFFEDIVAVRSWNTTRGDFFGATQATAFAPSVLPSDKNQNAIFFGNGAIGKGISRDKAKFTTVLSDHENVKEIAVSVINGYNRADYFDEALDGETAGGGAANAFSKNNAAAGVTDAIACTNQSSLILMTKSTAT